MKLKIVKGERFDEVTQKVKDNLGYCPCMLLRNEDTRCVCKEFRDLNTEGYCRCERYKKVKIT